MYLIVISKIDLFNCKTHDQSDLNSIGSTADRGSIVFEL